MELKTYYWIIGILMFLILLFVIKYYADKREYFPKENKEIVDKLLNGDKNDKYRKF